MIKTVWQSSIAPVCAALTANLVAALLVSLNTLPIIINFAATGVFLVILHWFGALRVTEHLSGKSKIRAVLVENTIILSAVTLGAWLSLVLSGNSSLFHFFNTTPPRFDIAVFGSFFVGLSSQYLQRKFKSKSTYNLLLVSLFWIAPFYGYFYAPIFLGMSIIHIGDQLTLTQMLLLTLGIFVGDQLGQAIAHWLKTDSRETVGK